MTKPPNESQLIAGRSFALVSETRLLRWRSVGCHRIAERYLPLAWIIHDFAGEKRKGALKD
jgi:hypothetical protein